MRYGGAPLLQQGTDGITVQGYGSATAPADAAIVEFYFSSNGSATGTSSDGAEPGFSGSAEPVPVPDQQRSLRSRKLICSPSSTRLSPPALHVTT
jgi:hypothetical protein